MNKIFASSQFYYFSSSSAESISAKLEELNKLIETHNNENLKKFHDLNNMDSLIKHAFDEFSLLECEIVNFCEIDHPKQHLETKISFMYKIKKYLISK